MLAKIWKQFVKDAVANGMKSLPVMAALFPVVVAAQDINGMFKGGGIEVPSVSAKPEAGEVHGLLYLTEFAMPRMPASATKKKVFHLRVLESKQGDTAKLIIGEPRSEIDYKLAVTQVPEEEQDVK